MLFIFSGISVSKITFLHILSLHNSPNFENCCAFEEYNILCSVITGGVSNLQFDFSNSFNFHIKGNIYMRYNHPGIA